MNLLLNEIAKAVGGELQGAGGAMARGYSIDSRTLGPGDLFFAIRGPHFDGHDFASQALEKQAAGVVVESGWTGTAPPEAAVIRVRSTVESLQTLARHVRQQWGKPIVGITGSAGKTTTKEMIASVLARKFKVLRSVGNLNNEYGLPLCLLRAERDQDIGVIEMGMSARGEIARLASIAWPNDGVITNVNPVHLEFFKSVDEIAEAKAELLQGLVSPKRAYLNNDDSRVRAMARRFDGPIVTYGVKSVAAFRAVNVQDLGLEGTAFRVRHNRREMDMVLPLLGRHNVTNAVAAVAVGVTRGVDWERVREAIGEMKPEKMRGRVVRFQEGIAAIDDSYNSNPKALTEMIRFLGRLDGFKRKILVAGEMLELGPESAEMHRACGREAERADIAMILGVQGHAAEILEGARAAGADPEGLRFFADATAAGEALERIARPGDVILFKASRGVKLELALNVLRARFRSMEP
ncbi:MAG TPA: UDP-N-acetylmuramoyl-tripeptide--D-alanyl-D-alanine ligase [Terriglobia bacterium]|nr:UDP-N-acetylmuramoyl-tripeptide--D-alanyl-D-alanine ligase [Terriglobia bacterium]